MCERIDMDKPRYGWFYIRECPEGKEWDAPVNVYRVGPRGRVKGYEGSFDRPSEMREIILSDEPNADLVKIQPGYFKNGKWITHHIDQ